MEINNITKKIIKKIKSKKTVISVIGLGYVGLPLSIALSNSKFKVFGIDNNFGLWNGFIAPNTFDFIDIFGVIYIPAFLIIVSLVLLSLYFNWFSVNDVCI